MIVSDGDYYRSNNLQYLWMFNSIFCLEIPFFFLVYSYFCLWWEASPLCYRNIYSVVYSTLLTWMSMSHLKPHLVKELVFVKYCLSYSQSTLINGTYILSTFRVSFSILFSHPIPSVSKLCHICRSDISNLLFPTM